nr:hypothetical protein [Tanacetum cinerariifolium]
GCCALYAAARPRHLGLQPPAAGPTHRQDEARPALRRQRPAQHQPFVQARGRDSRERLSEQAAPDG